MRAQIEDRLARLDAAGGLQALGSGITVGLERECLRVAPDGVIAFTPHPRALGSALTHPWITTDYSEALLELVTPPLGSPPQISPTIPMPSDFASASSTRRAPEPPVSIYLK